MTSKSFFIKLQSIEVNTVKIGLVKLGNTCCYKINPYPDLPQLNKDQMVKSSTLGREDRVFEFTESDTKSRQNSSNYTLLVENSRDIDSI